MNVSEETYLTSFKFFFQFNLRSYNLGASKLVLADLATGRA